MVIRPYQPADVPTLHRIDRLCFPRGVAYTLSELRGFIEHPGSVTLVAEDDAGQIAGFIIAQVVRLGKRRGASVRRECRGHIVTIDLRPQNRQQGLGSALLQQAEAWLIQQGADTVFLETAADNRAAISFYRKHGFRLVDRLRHYYGNGSDAYLMARRLAGR